MRKLNDEEKDREYQKWLKKIREYIIDGQIIPYHIGPGIARWIVYGIRPGSFLNAVIENNLHGAFANADLENRRNLFAIVAFFVNKAPAACWGKGSKNWLGTVAYIEVEEDKDEA